MFGFYRTFLAVMVLCYHLFFLPKVGHYAVHAFFILSGYLMTYIMHHTYGYTLKGCFHFIANRALRIYPMYFVVLILTSITILIAGESSTREIVLYMIFPDNISVWLQNISLFFLDWMPNPVGSRLVPQSWALMLELVFYVLIALGISKKKGYAVAWFIVSALFTILLVIYTKSYIEFDFIRNYFFIPTASLPFSVGALIFYYKDKFPVVVNQKNHLVLILIFMSFYLVNSIGSSYLYRVLQSGLLELVSFYFNILNQSVLVVLFLNLNLSKKWRKLDSEIGRYSYPIYLCHSLAGVWTSIIFFGGMEFSRTPKGILLSIIAFLLSIVVSFILITLLDKPIDRLRKRVKEDIKTKQELTSA